MAELRLRLREATAPLHERVDAAYSDFDLGRPEDYRRFLRAHARASVPRVTGVPQQRPNLGW